VIEVLLFSLITAIIVTILVVPFTRKMSENGSAINTLSIFIATVYIISFVAIFALFYFMKIDLNWSILIFGLPVVALLGAIISSGMEQKVKSLVTLIGIILLAYLLSAPFWNANEKYKSAEMEEAVEIKAFDETKTPASVPPRFVENKMKKAFGQVPNTSFYELGRLQIQKLNGEYVYVAPVEFSGFFKWFNGDETPGYFVMSATNASDNPKFVKAEMKYVPSAYLNDNLTRYIRLQHPKLIFHGEPQLEVDDEGKPFYVQSYGKFISARNGFDVQGIILVDPATGETTKYTLDEVPNFIDGAVAPEAVSLQNSYYGNYVHGYWNSLFGKKDVKIPTDEGTEANVSPIFTEDGEMYYFTDFTSPKEGVNSMLGYALTNARTGEATYYKGNGEDSYMDSKGVQELIEKEFIEKQWEGSMPIIYNFYGEVSWLAAVLDSNGFLQNYFIVSAANPEISVYASTPNEALKLYKTAINRGSSTVDGSSNTETKETTFTVARVYKERIGDFTYVSILSTTGENYLVSTELVPLAVYIEPGDTLQVTYYDTNELFLSVKELEISTLLNSEVIE
jgi:hypothetical protein